MDSRLDLYCVSESSTLGVVGYRYCAVVHTSYRLLNQSCVSQVQVDVQEET
jgi:hypothetical protein